MTDEQLEQKISEEFEKWEKSCDSYELRKSYDAEVEKRFEVNKKNPNHINEEDALQASRAEAWGKEAFKAAALPLMKEIKEIRRINQSEALLNTSLHRENEKLQKENEELERKISVCLDNGLGWEDLNPDASLPEGYKTYNELQKENDSFVKKIERLENDIANRSEEMIRLSKLSASHADKFLMEFAKSTRLQKENEELKEDLKWLTESTKKHPHGTVLKARYKEIRTKFNLDKEGEK